MLVEAEGFREKLAHEIVSSALHRGLESEKILDLLISKVGEAPDATALAAALDEKDRRLLFEILFESSGEATWESAESCLSVLRSRQDGLEAAELQHKIESKSSPSELNRALAQKLELQKKLAQR